MQLFFIGLGYRNSCICHVLSSSILERTGFASFTGSGLVSFLQFPLCGKNQRIPNQNVGVFHFLSFIFTEVQVLCLPLLSILLRRN